MLTGKERTAEWEGGEDRRAIINGFYSVRFTKLLDGPHEDFGLTRVDSLLSSSLWPALIKGQIPFIKKNKKS